MATKCPHSDVDVNGYCYACGAYVEGRAAGAAIAALFPELYEAVTERPAWLDAKSDGPMADARSSPVLFLHTAHRQLVDELRGRGDDPGRPH